MKKATAIAVAFFVWRPHGDSNPGYRRERVVNWTSLDFGGKYK
jgi:hypothetical protein